jgi:PilZ domain-containing protein
MSVSAVVIAASNLMPSLRDRLQDEGELLAFADTEPIQALQAILEHVPNLIVLERLFAATPRGAALINRIKTDPQLLRAEVRVMSHTGDYSRVVRPATVESPATAAAVSAGRDTSMPTADAPAALEVQEAPRQLDWHGTRRAPRYRIRDGVEVQLDGNAAAVIDLSVIGAQVLSATILRPNQRVRISVPTDDFVMRFRGAVAWAKFELPKPTEPPRYRAGIEFLDADTAAMDDYCTRYKL